MESLHDVINPLVSGLGAVAEKYGGTIEKYAGDAVLVVYGAPVTHEDDAQRALLTALEMHSALPGLLSAIGPAASTLTIHVGVNTGRVIAGQIGSDQQGDYSVLGDSVILAQRLESVCPPGETYVGATTQALTKDEFEFESVGELQLKGKLAPVEAFRLVGPRGRRATPNRPLVGRRRELATMDGVLAELQSGAGSLVTVVGEPGTGKSRLLAEVRQHAAATGLTWLSARCLSYGATIAYWPITDLLTRALQVRPGHNEAEALALVERNLPPETVAAAQRLLGLATEPMSPEQARRQVHDGVLAWLRLVSQEQPTALLIEDVHWADAATIDVLREVARELPTMSLALLLSARPAAAESLERISGDTGRTDLALGPLDTRALTSLVTAVLGDEPSDALVDLLSHRTAGNPLFAEELARSLLETDALVRTVTGWDLRPGWDSEHVPQTIERVFAARLDLLPPAATALLQTASVVGRTTTLALLRASCGTDDVDEPLQVLVSHGLLDEVPGGVTFHHALLQDVVYGRLLRKRRRELHRAVADAGVRVYGDRDETVDLLARHLYLAEAGEEAIEPLLRAGRRAARMYANDEASVHLGRALEVLTELGDESPRRTDVELELAQLHQLRGDPAAAQTLYETAIEREDRAAAWAGLMSSYRALGSYPEVLASFETARKKFDPRSLEAGPIWLECANTLFGMGRFSDAISMLRTQLRLLPAGARVLRGQVLSQLGYAESQLRLPSAARHAEEAVALLDQPDSLRELVTALRIAGMAQVYAGDLDAARSHLDRGMATAERIGLLVEAAGCLLNSGLAVLEADPVDAAARFASALDRFTRIGHPAGRVQAIGNLADALCRAGELDEAERAVDKAVHLANRIGHRLTVADVTWTLAKIRLARGQAAEAADAAEVAAALFLELDDLTEAAACLELGHTAAIGAGDSTRARSLKERALAVATG